MVFGMKTLLILAGALALAAPARAQVVGPVSHRDVPACPDSGGNHLNYQPATGVFSCGTTGNVPAIGNDTVLGNVSGGTAAAGALTQGQLTALVQPFTAGLSGAVPASGGGTTSFLRADGTWAAPPGGGAATPRIVQSQVVAYPSSALSVALPAVPQPGNMLLFVGTKWSTSPSMVPGWTQLYWAGSESNDGLMVVYRYAMPGDTGSITLSTQATGWSGCLFELSGVAAGNIVSVQEGDNYSGGGTSVSAGSGLPDDDSILVGIVFSEGAATQPTVTLTGATQGQSTWATGSSNGGNRFVASFSTGPLPRGGATIGAAFSSVATGANIMGAVAISPVR
ncbi:hypothetical protein HLH33_11160 [Gluconacetobacter diazotrophicus]|uniref:Uncharacterized protein n=2 Tax=Gluconacetobacter diazotrophicus TaxID=33996 RepID=A0A7W4I5X8_GLUDI|nr:hypothetical protein [Gluconacetobacter diazotrophicus]